MKRVWNIVVNSRTNEHETAFVKVGHLYTDPEPTYRLENFD